MEKSKTQEAMAEYKAMARDLAEEFQDKVANPTAEAFIEWLGEIVTRGSIMPCFGRRHEDFRECHELSPERAVESSMKISIVSLPHRIHLEFPILETA